MGLEVSGRVLVVHVVSILVVSMMMPVMVVGMRLQSAGLDGVEGDVVHFFVYDRLTIAYHPRFGEIQI